MRASIWRAVFAAMLGLGATAPALAADVTVYKSPTCGCCKEWVKHMQASGFSVKTVEVNDIVKYKTANGVPYELGSCHTATVNGYVIEGHVPASDVKRLLAQHPAIRGLAVPGMPNGAPGMEQGGPKVHYDVLAFDNRGSTRVFASH